MKICCTCFLLIFLLSAATYGGNAVNFEGKALLSLVSHWKVVPPSIKFSWNASDPNPCSWLGVHCSRSNIVDQLNLSSLAITGQLGPEIEYLTHLELIDLSSNDFFGRIPSVLGNCSNLESLDLSNNFFNREIPESVGNLKKLEFLSLWSNNLDGRIPESLFRISSLSLIYFNNNKLNGPIPSDFRNMTALKSLYLNNNLFSGAIPSSIGNCSALQELYLNDNLLQGALPRSLNNLEHLAFLYVDNNNLEGRIPSLDSCKGLESLVLSNNKFSGGIPPELSNCSRLTNLAAVKCGLSGSIPSSLGNLTRLNLLYLSENRLSGQIPPELGNCKALTDLQLSKNKLNGAIPSELGTLDQLQTIMLFTNNLSGEIPTGIWRIQSLQKLIVYENNLVGEIPNEIIELKQLSCILLFDNQLSGVLPQGLGINSSLTQVDLSRNRFTGPIPPNLCFGKKLMKLILGQNSFEGSIPSDIGSCNTLSRLILKQNNLKGRIPDFVKHMSLQYMDVSNNSISASVPSSLGNLANVTSIDLSYNKLTGDIPPELGRLLNLEYLSLSHNRLEGVLPSQLSGCRKLSKLDLGHNLLNGSIPSSLRSLRELSVLDLSENGFEGGIPTSLFQLGKLSSLLLGANQLGGHIPPSIGLEVETQSLRSLNLSRNGLIGRLPQELGRLKMLEQLDICCNNLSGSLETVGVLHSLTEVNVSYNSFDGPILPALMKFLISSPSSFVGNQDLCIDCGGGSCEGSDTYKICGTGSRKRGLNYIDIALVVAGSSLLAIVLILGVSYAFLRRKKQERDALANAEEGASSFLNKVLEATENLHEKYIVGRGAHGIVYKVALSPTKVYALKKLSFAGSKGGNTSMIREIQTIGKVRHRNLVKLEDFWLRKDYGLILYTYMENGSLHDVLHEILPPLPLKWEVRYKIALGAAQGLMYLHFDCDPPIIHHDIKPMNILLDSAMEAHISDFGIAKLLDESVSSSQAAVEGTIGYIAPENAFSTRSSRESDVYAYGVVLLELVTRKRVSDTSFGEGVDVVRWARSVWDEGADVAEIVDADVVSELVDSRVKEQVEDVVLLALRCTDVEAEQRPSMREIVKQLVLVENRNRSKGR